MSLLTRRYLANDAGRQSEPGREAKNKSPYKIICDPVQQAWNTSDEILDPEMK
jgi:hypothetical protein